MNSRGEWGTTSIPRVILKFPDDIPQADSSDKRVQPTDANTQMPRTQTHSSTPGSKRKRRNSPDNPRNTNPPGPLLRFLANPRSTTDRQSAYDIVNRNDVQAELSLAQANRDGIVRNLDDN